MFRSASVFAIVLVVFLSTAKAEEIGWEVSNIDQLAEAITWANSQSEGTHVVIEASNPISVPPDSILPQINSWVTMFITFQGVEGGSDQLLYIGESGKVELQISIFDFDVYTTKSVAFIENHGDLKIGGELRSVKGAPLCSRTGCYFASGSPIIFNAASGQLTGETLLISESGYERLESYPSLNKPNNIVRNLGSATFIDTQIYSTTAIEAPFFNGGSMRLQNVSLLSGADSFGQYQPAIDTDDSSDTEVVNSVFDGFSGEWCQSVQSMGFNMSNSEECTWQATADLVGKPSGLLWREASELLDEAAFEYSLIPILASAAVDSGSNEYCSPKRVLADGNGDGTVVCDRGAVELLPRGLGNGGINGLFYNPEADGHYVQILQTDYTVLVTWLTFDNDGNQVWVFGTGDLVGGRSVVAESYINVNDGRLPDGSYPPSEAVYWGTLEVDLESCTQGSVGYSSSYSGFGDGVFPIKRLGYIKQLGCIDQN